MSASVEPTQPVIDVRSASFGYAGSPVITDASFSVHAGEVVALLGPNGSGKSTLVRGLLGLNDHLDGQIEVLGAEVTRGRDRTPIGYVPQRHTLSSSVRSTVREVVATGRLTHRSWWRRASALDRELVADALETVGLSDRASADVATLSGGQQRRVLIARALAGRPEVLIMDEPTAGVDAASQDVLTRVLQRLVDRGVTMLVVTHDLSVLHQVVTRILAMEAGSFTFDGAPADYTAYLQTMITGQPGGGDHHHHDDLRVRPRLMAGPSDAREKGHQHG
ncbi:MAG: metal ABC transporter ATP-binding protein [Ornithinimicrobium sp.]